ncbi:hypothetical protein BDK51DRAFT_47495 [Blyttiomyces helicus]|uniref:Uncharacterized protein n=1 Tax=Blyttiomyces helicus TaxID=388810 RepID=A0A4V1IQA5_9FUNG|nr:hypothetical protein BDK51DRAFT_47495 [Blyttiomyces helicus]|eukprot:RKO85877.1 hypothetical protein BDK51DRAFT_47495 [Blyttiomyces helicus]
MLDSQQENQGPPSGADAEGTASGGPSTAESVADDADAEGEAEGDVAGPIEQTGAQDTPTAIAAGQLQAMQAAMQQVLTQRQRARQQQQLQQQQQQHYQHPQHQQQHQYQPQQQQQSHHHYHRVQQQEMLGNDSSGAGSAGAGSAGTPALGAMSADERHRLMVQQQQMRQHLMAASNSASDRGLEDPAPGPPATPGEGPKLVGHCGERPTTSTQSPPSAATIATRTQEPAPHDAPVNAVENSPSDVLPIGDSLEDPHTMTFPLPLHFCYSDDEDEVYFAINDWSQYGTAGMVEFRWELFEAGHEVDRGAALAE